MYLSRIKKCHKPYQLSSCYIKCATKQCSYPKHTYLISKKNKDKINNINRQYTEGHLDRQRDRQVTR